MNIHDRLKFLRESLGLTVRTFGASIGMSEVSVLKMEKGERTITPRTSKRIIYEYNVNPSWFVDGIGPMYREEIGDSELPEHLRNFLEHGGVPECEAKNLNVRERLCLLRKELRLSTNAFGASIGISGAAINYMENGKRNITRQTILDICREHNVNPDWLTDGLCPKYQDARCPCPDSNKDVDKLVSQYALLGDKDRELIKNLIDLLVEKLSAGAVHQEL